MVENKKSDLKVLADALVEEIEGKENYKNIKETSKNEKVVALVGKLEEAEKGHIKEIYDLLGEIGGMI